jgi:hypothetical protein
MLIKRKLNGDEETVQENESSRQMLACHHSLKFSPSRHDVRYMTDKVALGQVFLVLPTC